MVATRFGGENGFGCAETDHPSLRRETTIHSVRRFVGGSDCVARSKVSAKTRNAKLRLDFLCHTVVHPIPFRVSVIPRHIQYRVNTAKRYKFPRHRRKTVRRRRRVLAKSAAAHVRVALCLNDLWHTGYLRLSYGQIIFYSHTPTTIDCFSNGWGGAEG